MGILREHLVKMNPEDEPLAFPCSDNQEYSRCTTVANKINNHEGERTGKYIHVSRDYPDSLVFFVCVSREEHRKEMTREKPPLEWRKRLAKKKRGKAYPAPISCCDRKSLRRKQLLLFRRTGTCPEKVKESHYRTPYRGCCHRSERIPQMEDIQERQPIDNETEQVS